MLSDTVVTIPRVTTTAKVEHKTHGRIALIEQPEVGALVLKKDSGFSSTVGFQEPYVVIAVSHRKDGFVNLIQIAPIAIVSNSDVSYDKNDPVTTLKPYFSIVTGDHWNTNSGQPLYDYYFDQYGGVTYGNEK